MEEPLMESLRRRTLSSVLRGSLALPGPTRRLVFGAPVRNDRGELLDADAHVLTRLDAWTQPPLGHDDVGHSRRSMRRGTAIIGRPRPAHVISVDAAVAGVPTRRYTPTGLPPHAPLLVFFHGGGWVLGDLDTHDALCARLAASLPAVVLAVDYRLAPEHPCPAAFEDALAVFRAARGEAAAWGADRQRIGVGGDSAGGNLAAAVSMACRDAGEPMPKAQLLIYPATDLRRLTASHRTCAEGPLLTAADIQFFLDAYAAPDLEDPRVSPGAAADLAGLPPAVVTTCGFDPLRDEGDDYARRLAEAGVEAAHLHHADLMHGYASMDGVLEAADAAVEAFIVALRPML